jgi:hypothetical protein
LIAENGKMKDSIRGNSLSLSNVDDLAAGCLARLALITDLFFHCRFELFNSGNNVP